MRERVSKTKGLTLMLKVRWLGSTHHREKQKRVQSHDSQSVLSFPPKGKRKWKNKVFWEMQFFFAPENPDVATIHGTAPLTLQLPVHSSPIQ